MKQKLADKIGTIQGNKAPEPEPAKSPMAAPQTPPVAAPQTPPVVAPQPLPEPSLDEFDIIPIPHYESVDDINQYLNEIEEDNRRKKEEEAARLAAEKKKKEEKEQEENSIENPISQIIAMKHPEFVENAK